MPPNHVCVACAPCGSVAPEEGLLEHLAVDPLASSWLVTGSNAGYLGLWDLRFQLQVRLKPAGRAEPAFEALNARRFVHIRSSDILFSNAERPFGRA